MSSGWIGVDLDGTLAHYEGWRGPEHIGAPIPEMIQRVKAWVAAGHEVRIFTARVWPYTNVVRPGEPMAVQSGLLHETAFLAACAIGQWCVDHIGFALPLTCVKDYGMVELWDDRAVRVVANTGKSCCQKGA